MALAALIIKERLGVTDEECVEQIRENLYLEYFCGMKAFSTDRSILPPHHAGSFSKTVSSRCSKKHERGDRCQSS
jgi:hypothetical protein